MNMISHYYPGVQLIVAQLPAFVQAVFYKLGYCFLAQEHRALASRIEIAIHPDESLSTRRLVRRRVQAMRETSMQVPGEKQSFAIRIPMRQAAPMETHRVVVGVMGTVLWRRDESRRGGEKSPRHHPPYWYRPCGRLPCKCQVRN